MANIIISDENDNLIDHIVNSFTNLNMRDIKEINKNKLDFVIAEFILCSCLIDQLSGFRYNTDKVGKRYRQFVKEYLPKYNPNELYEDLRNKLVHNYSLGEFYELRRRSEMPHPILQSGRTRLVLEDFIVDLESAMFKLFQELKTIKSIRNNAVEWFEKHEIIGQKFE